MPRAPKGRVTHVTPVTQIFPCDLCGMEFARKHDLSRHSRSHSTSENRIFRCHWENCPFTANQQGGLDAHINTHTGAKPYKCNFCVETYGDRSSRSRHMRKKHVDEYTPAARKPRTVPKKKRFAYSPYPSQSVAPPIQGALDTFPYSSLEYYPSPMSLESSASSSSCASSGLTAPSPEFYLAQEPSYYTPDRDYCAPEYSFTSGLNFLMQPTQPTPDASSTPSLVEKPDDAAFFGISALCDMASQVLPAKGLHQVVNDELPDVSNNEEKLHDFDSLDLVDAINFDLLGPTDDSAVLNFPLWDQDSETPSTSPAVAPVTDGFVSDP